MSEIRDGGEKLIIVAKDGQADVEIRHGSASVKLEDRSTGTFTAADISAFIEYVNEQCPPEYVVFVGPQKWTVYPAAVGADGAKDVIHSYDAQPYAVVNYGKSMVLQRIERLLDREIPIEELENSVKPLLQYGDTKMIKLFEFSRNCNIQSYTKMQRQVNTDGSFSFVCSVENKSDQAHKPPEKLAISIPLIHRVEAKADFELDVSYSHKVQNGPKISVVISSCTFAERVEVETLRMVAEMASKFTLERDVYWGEYNTTNKTNLWEHKVL